DLIPPHAVKCRLGERVVVVVPALPQSKQPHDPLIATLIRRIERAAAELVTHRIDRPREVMCDEDAHQATPENSSPPVEQVGQRQPKPCPQNERLTDEAGNRVSDQMPGVLFRYASIALEEPAEVGVEQPF